MKLLNMDIYKSLFLQNNRIYTKVKDEVPTKYNESSNVVNSLVANGCQIEGEVKNCVIFRETNIEKNAKIENSIIMARAKIGEDAYLKNIILDKEVEVSQGQELIGPPDKPFVIAKRRKI
jgi:glucose-1-phosphate adenylyltransferase